MDEQIVQRFELCHCGLLSSCRWRASDFVWAIGHGQSELRLEQRLTTYRSLPSSSSVLRHRKFRLSRRTYCGFSDRNGLLNSCGSRRGLLELPSFTGAGRAKRRNLFLTGWASFGILSGFESAVKCRFQASAPGGIAGEMVRPPKLNLDPGRRIS